MAFCCTILLCRLYRKYAINSMDKTAARNRITELSALIKKYSREYYELDAPTVSDVEYDNLFKELETLEKDYPEYKQPDSPTVKVGSTGAKKFSQIKHKVRLYSLDNTYSYDDLKVWYERLQKNFNLEYPPKLVCELKIDGLAISLTYKNSEFSFGATRITAPLSSPFLPIFKFLPIFRAVSSILLPSRDLTVTTAISVPVFFCKSQRNEFMLSFAFWVRTCALSQTNPSNLYDESAKQDKTAKNKKTKNENIKDFFIDNF